MQISPIPQPQSTFNTIINPQQAPSNNPSTAIQANDKVSISSAAKALAGSEANESPVIETTEIAATQVSEGEASTGKSLSIIA